MAKAVKWKLTERQENLYNRLVKEANKIRKVLLKTRASYEAETPVGRLPALVIPKQYKSSNRLNWRRIRREMGKREFMRKLKEMKMMFGEGMKSYLRNTYKRGYLLLWQDHIGESPVGKFGRYSEEQMLEADSKISEFMRMYNLILTMSPLSFYHMSQKGFLVDFKYIYDYLQGKDNNAISEQIDNISLYWKLFSKKGFEKDDKMSELANIYNQRTFTRVAHKEADLLLKKIK